MSPSIDRSISAGDRVIESIANKNSSISYSNLLIITNLDFLFTIIIVEFNSKVIHRIGAL